MKQILIVGQALSARAAALKLLAWETPPGGKLSRLYRWFGVRSYRELSRMAYLANAAEFVSYKDRDAWRVSEKRLAQIAQFVGRSQVVFLVGKVAQRQVCRLAFSVCGLTQLVPPDRDRWKIGKFVGIPHPSGRNRVLNGRGASRTERFVQGILEELCECWHGHMGVWWNSSCPVHRRQPATVKQ